MSTICGRSRPNGSPITIRVALREPRSWHSRAVGGAAGDTSGRPRASRRASCRRQSDSRRCSSRVPVCIGRCVTSCGVQPSLPGVQLNSAICGSLVRKTYKIFTLTRSGCRGHHVSETCSLSTQSAYSRECHRSGEQPYGGAPAAHRFRSRRDRANASCTL